MKILLACEESQAVCLEMRKKGHDAFSCDILPCSGGKPEWHIQGDVLEQLDKDWDMMIAFPPCTHLAVSGAKHFEQKRRDGRQQEGIDFFMKIVNANIPLKATENPIGIMSTVYREPDQIIHPYYFGDEAQKPTCLWLEGLPLLKHYSEDDLFNKKTHVGKGEFHVTSGGNRLPSWYNLPPSDDRALKRSRTFPGIAKAIGEQWGCL
jgi:hypothetical protein